MDKVKIIRTQTNEHGTFGILYINDELFCVTAELPKYGGVIEIENERSTDCIPTGIYHCHLVYSPKFKTKLYELKAVPNRSNILIHSGNIAGDINKGFETDVEGCILLGSKLGALKGQQAVLDSRRAVSAFMAQMENKPFDLEVIEEF